MATHPLNASSTTIGATLSVLLLATCTSEIPPDTSQADTRLQRSIERLTESDDAVAVLELQTGRLRAVVNNDRLGRHGRAGSVLKVATAATALLTGLPDEPYTCNGNDTFAGQKRECWQPNGHSTVRLQRALAHSCNLYFHALASRLNPDSFLKTLRAFRVGEPTGWAPGEGYGVVPRALSRGELLDAVVGMGDDVQVTGWQLLRMIAILSATGDFGGQPHASDEQLRQAMRDAVEFGTAGPNRIEVTFAGKTGTAARIGSWRVSGWFVGYAPALDPRFAFVVFKGKSTGSDAAALGQKVIDATFAELQ